MARLNRFAAATALAALAAFALRGAALVWRIELPTYSRGA